MIITYELRAWAREHRVLVGGLGLEEIADRIDEGQAQLEEDLDLAFGKSEELSRVIVDVAESLGVDTMLTDEDVYEALLESAEGCIQLPKDADGETIHLQDRMSWDNGTFNVHELKLDADGWTTWDELHGYTVRADQCHHVTPDSWERIIEDALKLGVEFEEKCLVMTALNCPELVERCKRLAGEDA